MKNLFGKTVVLAAALVLAGCFTVSRTEYPAVEVRKLPADREVKVQLVGFDAMLTRYVQVQGYSTVFGAVSCRDRWGWRHVAYVPQVVSTTEYVPQTEPTAAFRDRATDILERSGFRLRAPDPRYQVEVRFDGPRTLASDFWKGIGWLVGTVFTADYGATSWSAALRIRDLADGRLVFSQDYVQRYEALTWGPLPIISPAFSEETDESVMQCWCLTALTDRTVSDAIAFLGGDGAK